MATLLETFAAPQKRQAVIQDSLQVIDDEVASKGGLSGIAIKTGYKLVKGFKPGFISEVVDALLDDFCRNLQPIVDQARAKNAPIGRHMLDNRGAVADALLGITDSRAQRSKHGVIKGTYEKLRPSAKKYVEEAVPRVATLIEKHAG